MREACERRHTWTRTDSPGNVAPFALGLLLLTVATACGSIGGPPPTPVVVVVTAVPPSPVVIVVTATPGQPTPAPAATPTIVAASKPGACITQARPCDARSNASSIANRRGRAS